MNGLDIVLSVVIAGIGVLGIVRGFGRMGLDALALYAGLWGATFLAPLLAAKISLHAGGAGINQSWAFVLLFFLLGALLLCVSWYVYGMTQINAGMFDKLLGLAVGLGAGVILAHCITQSLVIADPNQEASAALVGTGSVGTEVYAFPLYHSVMDTVTGSKTYMRNMADVGGK